MIILRPIRKSIEAQIILKIRLPLSDFKNLCKIPLKIPVKPPIIINPDKKVPRPKNKAYLMPLNAFSDIKAIWDNKIKSGEHGAIPIIKPKIKTLLKITFLFFNASLQRKEFFSLLNNIKKPSTMLINPADGLKRKLKFLLNMSLSSLPDKPAK
jgi:hypothetical protein